MADSDGGQGPGGGSGPGDSGGNAGSGSSSGGGGSVGGGQSGSPSSGSGFGGVGEIGGYDAGFGAPAGMGGLFGGMDSGVGTQGSFGGNFGTVGDMGAYGAPDAFGSFFGDPGFSAPENRGFFSTPIGKVSMALLSVLAPEIAPLVTIGSYLTDPTGKTGFAGVTSGLLGAIGSTAGPVGAVAGSIAGNLAANAITGDVEGVTDPSGGMDAATAANSGGTGLLDMANIPRASDNASEALRRAGASGHLQTYHPYYSSRAGDANSGLWS